MPITQAFPWPLSARAAVSLTYDDAMASQLALAVPALDEAGLKATFFVSDRGGAASRRQAEWAQVCASGHELGGHTMQHPCRGTRSWLKAGETLEGYDEARLLAEFLDSKKMLLAMGAAEAQSFAYTCGDTELGSPPRSFIPMVRQHYAAARGTHSRLCDPLSEDLHHTGTLHGDSKSGEALIALVEEAAAQGAWAVFMFHGIGEGNLAVDKGAHRVLLSYLSQHREKFWVAPFGEAARHIAGRRQP